MRTRSLSLAAILLVTGCSETYDPQPPLSIQSAGNASPGEKVPDCPQRSPDLDGFSIIAATLRRNGEVERFQDFFQQLRGLLGARLDKSDPATRKRFDSALDGVFSVSEIETLTLCAFSGFDMVQPAFEAWEAWSLDPRMREIHAAIVDIDVSGAIPARNQSLTENRRAHLQRVSRAVDLPGYQHAMAALRWRIVAVAEAAMDPASSLQQDLAMNPRNLGVPPEQVLVDHFLGGALKNASDEELQRFLIFAESREGQAYYTTLRELRMQLEPWTQRVAATLRPFAGQNTIMRDPEEARRLLVAARRVFDQVGTRVVVPEARTLLVQAERLDPDNAEVQVLLARVALASLPPAFMQDDFQIRPLIDRTHSANPERYAEVEKHLRRALEIDPENAQAILYLGRVQFMLSRDEEAAKLYARSRQIDPQGPALAYFEADLAYVGGDYAQAERVYRQIIAAPEVRAFDHHFSLERLRIVLAKQGRESDFRQLANDQLERHPDMWDFRLKHAYRLVQSDGAAAEIEALISPVPDSWLPTTNAM
ncbi:MAG: tetratricopeptide repeat protein [Rhodanobacteraceae bacterium]|nr:tetratricopeptide repeat protein [Rhodanobacteraceae bacterium]